MSRKRKKNSKAPLGYCRPRLVDVKEQTPPEYKVDQEYRQPWETATAAQVIADLRRWKRLMES